MVLVYCYRSKQGRTFRSYKAADTWMNELGLMMRPKGNHWTLRSKSGGRPWGCLIHL